MKSKSEMRRKALQDPLAFVERMYRLEAVLAAARKYCTQADKPIPQKPDAEMKRFKLNLANGSKLREAIRLCDSQDDGKGEEAKMLLGHEDDCQIMRLGRKDLACDCSRFAPSGAADREPK